MQLLCNVQRLVIVGTWNLVSCDNKDQLVCASPNGIVSYDATGHYSQMFVPKGRKVDIPQGTTRATSQAIAQQTLRQQLVGTWTLASCDVKAPWCPGSGSWAFGGNGRYTLVIQGPRPKVSGTGPVNRTAVSAEEYKAIGQGNVSQFGTWSVNEADKTLTQHVESSFFGRSDGTDVKISISLTGDELKVSGTGGTETVVGVFAEVEGSSSTQKAALTV